MEGWCGPENERALLSAIQLVNPKVIVEIGVWKGVSTAFLAQHSAPDAVVYAVDHFLGSVEHRPGGVDGAAWEGKLSIMLDQFVSNMMRLGYSGKVRPVRMASAEAAPFFTEPIDLLYIDGSHEEPDVWHDITVWGAKVRPGGMIVGDDYSAGWPGVCAAVDRARLELGWSVSNDSRVWWYRQREA